MAKLIVMYPKPKDPQQFESYFREKHVPLVKKWEKMTDHSYGLARGPDGGEGAFFWTFVGTFASVKDIADTMESQEGKDAVADIPNYSPDHEPTILVVDSKD